MFIDLPKQQSTQVESPAADSAPMSLAAAAATVWVLLLPLFAIAAGFAVRSWHAWRATQAARWTAECRPYAVRIRGAECRGARHHGATTPARKPTLV